MWGSVTEGGDPDCSWANYPFTRGNFTVTNTNVFTKYVPYAQAYTYGYNNSYDGKTTLEPADDAATQAWGGGWRMPTMEEWKALCDNTTSTWVTSYKGKSVSGFLFQRKNDDSKELFLPAAGSYLGSGLVFSGSRSYYWSSSLYSSSPNCAYEMYFESGNVNPQATNGRCNGCTVRLVR